MKASSRWAVTALTALVLVLGWGKEGKGQDSLQLVGEHLSFFGRIDGMQIKDRMAYLSTPALGLLVYDLHDLNHPELVSRSRTIYTHGMTWWNGLLCGANSQQVLLIDASDPNEPRIINSINGVPIDTYQLSDTLCFTSWVQLENADDPRFPHVYVYSGFEINGLSDISRPNRLFRETYDSHGAGRDLGFSSIAYHQGFLYTGDWNNGNLIVWDVRNPTELNLVGGLGASASIGTQISNDRLFSFSYNNINAYSLQDPEHPELAGQIGNIRISGGMVQDSLLYLIGQNDSTLSIFNISNLDQPEQIGGIHFGQEPTGGLVVSDSIALIGSGSSAIILDVTNPASPSVASTIAGGPGSIRKSWKYSNLLFTCVDEVGLIISDCSTPAHPEELSRYAVGQSSEITASGNVVYIAVKDEGVHVLDVTNTAHPQLIEILRPWDGKYYGVASEANALYVCGSNGLCVYNISNPQRPEFVARNAVCPASYGLTITDSILVAFRADRVSIFTLHDPFSPRALNPYLPNPQGGNLQDDFVVNGKLFLLRYWTDYDYNTGTALDIIDISRSDSARMLGTLDSRSFPTNMSAMLNIGSTLGVIYNDTLSKYDFNGYPARGFRLMGKFALQVNSIGPAFVDDGYLYVQTPGSIDIYNAGPLSAHSDQPETPHSFYLSAPFPSPFNSTTTIRYSLPSNGPASLRIFDLQGRMVQTLFAGAALAGSHTAEFRAEGLGSGIYICRLEAGGRAESVKMVLVK